MKKNKKAEEYTSPILARLKEEINPEEKTRTTEKMKLAARIADLIERNSWTQKQFAKELKKDNPSEISRWLSGTHNFTVDTLTDICRVFNIPLSQLFGDKSESKISKQIRIEWLDHLHKSQTNSHVKTVIKKKITSNWQAASLKEYRMKVSYSNPAKKIPISKLGYKDSELNLKAS